MGGARGRRDVDLGLVESGTQVLAQEADLIVGDAGFDSGVPDGRDEQRSLRLLDPNAALRDPEARHRGGEMLDLLAELGLVLDPDVGDLVRDARGGDQEGEDLVLSEGIDLGSGVAPEGDYSVEASLEGVGG